MAALSLLALSLGLCCDYSNFRLAQARGRGEGIRTSPVILIPVLLNWFGSVTLFVLARGHASGWLFLSVALLLLLVLHIVCVTGISSQTET
jgi:hypothetical protein